MTTLTEEELQAITENVVEAIKKDYFLVRKTTDLSHRKESEIKKANFMNMVLDTLCGHFGVIMEDLYDFGGNARIDGEAITASNIRSMACYIFRTVPKLAIPYKQIADHMGMNSHGTAMNSIKEFKRKVLTNEELKLNFDLVMEKINLELSK